MNEDPHIVVRRSIKNRFRHNTNGELFSKVAEQFNVIDASKFCGTKGNTLTQPTLVTYHFSYDTQVYSFYLYAEAVSH